MDEQDARLLEELSEAQQRGPSSQAWIVYGAYEIKEGTVQVSAGAEFKKAYFPAGRRTLPFELAKVPWGDEKAALRIVDKWGMMSVSPFP